MVIGKIFVVEKFEDNYFPFKVFLKENKPLKKNLRICKRNIKEKCLLSINATMSANTTHCWNKNKKLCYSAIQVVLNL